MVNDNTTCILDLNIRQESVVERGLLRLITLRLKGLDALYRKTGAVPEAAQVASQSLETLYTCYSVLIQLKSKSRSFVEKEIQARKKLFDPILPNGKTRTSKSA